MDKASLQFTSRFSLPPNSLGYCGKDSAPAKFIKCVTECECAGVEDELTKFIVLHPYLKTISKILDMPKFAYEVSEAYWIGNEHLNRAKPSDYDLLLDNFAEQGVPDWFVAELREKKPKEFIPTHLFQVLHVGVGRASGSVPYNLETINNCMVRWGNVTKLNEKEVTVDLNSLKETKQGKYELFTQSLTFDYKKDFLEEIKVGSTVAVHWKQVIKVLTVDEVKKIEFWTNRVLQALS